MLNLHIPSEIAHWYDAAGRDLVANTQPETPAAEQAAPAPAVAASDPARAASVERPSRSGPSRRHQQQQQQHVQQSLPRAVPTSSGRSLAEGCSGATVSLSTAPKMAAQAASDAKQPLIAAKAGIAGVESTARRDSLDTAASLRNSQISEVSACSPSFILKPDKVVTLYFCSEVSRPLICSLVAPKMQQLKEASWVLDSRCGGGAGGASGA